MDTVVLDSLEEVWPETPTVNVRVSVELLKELANGDGPLWMASLGQPDAEGFYSPDFRLRGLAL